MPQLDLSWFLIKFFMAWMFSTMIIFYLKKKKWTNTSNKDKKKTKTKTKKWKW